MASHVSKSTQLPTVGHTRPSPQGALAHDFPGGQGVSASHPFHPGGEQDVLKSHLTVLSVKYLYKQYIITTVAIQMTAKIIAPIECSVAGGMV